MSLRAERRSERRAGFAAPPAEQRCCARDAGRGGGRVPGCLPLRVSEVPEGPAGCPARSGSSAGLASFQGRPVLGNWEDVNVAAGEGSPLVTSGLALSLCLGALMNLGGFTVQR